jgi:hypothetical protein
MLGELIHCGKCRVNCLQVGNVRGAVGVVYSGKYIWVHCAFYKMALILRAPTFLKLIENSEHYNIMPRLSEEEKARREEARKALKEQKKQAAEQAREEKRRAAALRAEAKRIARQADAARRKAEQEASQINEDIRRERERLRQIADAEALRKSIESRRIYLEKMKAILQRKQAPAESEEEAEEETETEEEPKEAPKEPEQLAAVSEESADSIVSCSEDELRQSTLIDWDAVEIPDIIT